MTKVISSPSLTTESFYKVEKVYVHSSHFAKLNIKQIGKK